MTDAPGLPTLSSEIDRMETASARLQAVISEANAVTKDLRGLLRQAERERTSLLRAAVETAIGEEVKAGLARMQTVLNKAIGTSDKTIGRRFERLAALYVDARTREQFDIHTIARARAIVRAVQEGSTVVDENGEPLSWLPMPLGESPDPPLPRSRPAQRSTKGKRRR